jgi:hypothetical protein
MTNWWVVRLAPLVEQDATRRVATRRADGELFIAKTHLHNHVLLLVVPKPPNCFVLNGACLQDIARAVAFLAR